MLRAIGHAWLQAVGVTPANDSVVDSRAIVKRGYDACAEAYGASRATDPVVELHPLLDRLDDGDAVLDVGCGTGVPIARILAQRSRVTGVDISSEMVRRACRNVPTGEFICADILSSAFPPSIFDAVVAICSVFHLPREEHAALFRRIHGWLKPGGHLLCTLTHRNEAGYTEDDFHGVTMYWSNYSLDEYREMLAEIGFQLLVTSMVGDANESHPLVLARKQRLHP